MRADTLWSASDPAATNCVVAAPRVACGGCREKDATTLETVGKGTIREDEEEARRRI